MKTALFSDIHANWDALKTAVEYAEGQGIRQFAVLGDSIGYGANPNECLDWVLQHASVNLMGNHEKALMDPALRKWFNPLAAQTITWTESVVEKKFAEKIRDFPYLKSSKEITFTHGSPDDPEKFRYLMSFGDASHSFRAFKGWICFVGHTHVPGCFCEHARSATYLKPGVMELSNSERYILNPGSVGQPRDYDPRLSFGIFDDEKKTFEIVRLEYDNQAAAQKIRKAGLPAYLADRLL